MSVVVSDRWRVGSLRFNLCPPVQDRCRSLTLAAGRTRLVARFRPRRPGPQRVTVRYDRTRHVTSRLLVRPKRTRLRVLATGDSMIQVLDDALRARLATRGPVSLVSDARISTGISKPFMFDWVRHAAASARSVKPDATVVFLGANDGFPIGPSDCCTEAWQARYADRAARMMRSYSRGGQSIVYWLLLPTPRRASFVEIYRSVNSAIRDAARRLPGAVEIIDLNRVFTPGGQFRQTMVWRGRRLSVRQADGVHLSAAGAQIAADVIARRMRLDGVAR